MAEGGSGGAQAAGPDAGGRAAAAGSAEPEQVRAEAAPQPGGAAEDGGRAEEEDARSTDAEDGGRAEEEPHPAGEAGKDLPAVAPESKPPAAQGGRGARARRTKAERRARREAVAGTDCPIVVDATNHIAGRLASNVAKLLLGGNRVSLVNCERIMISGTRANIVGEYKEFLEIASILHPKHGPFHPRRPDTIISRMIRGMLPREKPSGRAAHRRLRAYIGAPRELGAYKRVRFERAMIKRAPSGYTTMENLGDAVGWTR